MGRLRWFARSPLWLAGKVQRLQKVQLECCEANIFYKKGNTLQYGIEQQILINEWENITTGISDRERAWAAFEAVHCKKGNQSFGHVLSSVRMSKKQNKS
jgi:3,4-dihydroxy-2-butanone 4-phosphate synthase